MNPAWVSAAVALAVAVAAVSVWFMRIMWRLFQKIESFLEDWNGSLSSPGHPSRPGVMERLVSLEEDNVKNSTCLEKQNVTLEVIKGEVTYNSGHSIKDTVRVILARLDKFDPPGELTGRKQ